MSTERSLDPRYVEEKYGVDVNLMKRLANYLQSTGDTSAISYEKVQELPNAAPDFCALYLRWGLARTDLRVGILGTTWLSKGVRIQSIGSSDDKPVVLFTGDVKDLVKRPKDMARVAEESPRSVMEGWINLYNSPLYRRLYADLYDQRVWREKEFGVSTDELSLEEQVRLATIFAKPRPDYRYGVGNASGIEIKIEKSLLAIAA